MIFSEVQSNAGKTDEYSRKNTGGKVFYFFRLAGHRLHSTQLFRTLSFSSSSTLSMVFTITFWVCKWFFFLHWEQKAPNEMKRYYTRSIVGIFLPGMRWTLKRKSCTIAAGCCTLYTANACIGKIYNLKFSTFALFSFLLSIFSSFFRSYCTFLEYVVDLSFFCVQKMWIEYGFIESLHHLRNIIWFPIMTTQTQTHTNCDRVWNESN